MDYIPYSHILQKYMQFMYSLVVHTKKGYMPPKTIYIQNLHVATILLLARFPIHETLMLDDTSQAIYGKHSGGLLIINMDLPLIRH